MMSSATPTDSPSTSIPTPNLDAYVVIGLATCFTKQEGKLQPVQIVEPIPSAALEALLKGVPTSYAWVVATTLGAVNPEQNPNILSSLSADLPVSDTEEAPLNPAQLCPDFWERAQACARTYQARAVAQTHVSLGTVYRDLNFSTERPRTLNAERLVTANDNVKQHAYTHQKL
jgi:hypothetical protein